VVTSRHTAWRRARGFPYPAMASVSGDPQVKSLQPFLQRASEMQKSDPKIAYHARVFAMERGLQISAKSSAMISLLGTLMQQLEDTKQEAGLISHEEDSAYCENFAMKVFSKADALDRASVGKADATSIGKTAKMFYVASIFFEILHQFGTVDDDVLGKQKYAAWRAGDLTKCAREGRTPSEPPSVRKSGDGGDGDGVGDGETNLMHLSGAHDGMSTEPFGIPSPPAAKQTPSSAPPPPHCQHGAPPGVGNGNGNKIQPESNRRPTQTRPSPPQNLHPVSFGAGIGIESVAEAQKHAKFAVSALGFEDVPTAIDNLQKALFLLEGRLEPR
jgi:vacuolar protein sorting-associated protein VTA1